MNQSLRHEDEDRATRVICYCCSFFCIVLWVLLLIYTLLY
jgi:hypothetical protein